MIVAKTHTLLRHPSGRDLSGLMDVYESNFLRLRKLIPDLDAVSASGAVSRVAGALDLHLQVLERARYTATLNLTYRMAGAGDDGVVVAPDVTLRIYQDARLAEVLSCGQRRGRRAAEYDRMRHRYPLLRKWEINRFLQKWLGYCLHQGHGFGADGAPALANPPNWTGFCGLSN